MVVTTLEATMNIMQLKKVPEHIELFTSRRGRTQGGFIIPRSGLSEVTGMISTTMLRNTVRDIRIVIPENFDFTIVDQTDRMNPVFSVIHKI